MCWSCLGFIIISITFRCSSVSLLFQWICLEVNILIFSVIIGNQKELKRPISSIKYFICQTPPSIIILISLVIINTGELFNNIIYLCILYKLGVPPFHGWVINLVLRMNYFSLFLLLSLQKYILIFIMSSLRFNNLIIFIRIVAMTFIMLSLSKGVRFLPILLVISSITNLFLILIVLRISNRWFTIIIIYTYLLLCTCFILNLNNIYIVKDFLKKNFFIMIIVVIIILTIGGVPPIAMFPVKFVLIKTIIASHYLIISILIIIIIFRYYIYFNVFYVVLCYLPSSTLFRQNRGKVVKLISGSLLFFCLPVFPWFILYLIPFRRV